MSSLATRTSPSASTTTSIYPNLTLTGAFCGTDGAGAYSNYAVDNSTTTSCQFAASVRQVLLASGQAIGVPLSAISPVTGKGLCGDLLRRPAGDMHRG